MRRFSGGGLPEGASELSFEQTLEALLELDPRLQAGMVRMLAAGELGRALDR